MTLKTFSPLSSIRAESDEKSSESSWFSAISQYGKRKKSKGKMVSTRRLAGAGLVLSPMRPSILKRMADRVSEDLRIAIEHHSAGRLPEAESIYRRILTLQPHHADALHLLGLIAHQTNQSKAAIDLIGRAIAIQ